MAFRTRLRYRSVIISGLFCSRNRRNPSKTPSILWISSPNCGKSTGLLKKVTFVVESLQLLGYYSGIKSVHRSTTPHELQSAEPKDCPPRCRYGHEFHLCFRWPDDAAAHDSQNPWHWLSRIRGPDDAAAHDSQNPGLGLSRNRRPDDAAAHDSNRPRHGSC